jgi:hypothetical protein
MPRTRKSSLLISSELAFLVPLFPSMLCDPSERVLGFQKMVSRSPEEFVVYYDRPRKILEFVTSNAIKSGKISKPGNHDFVLPLAINSDVGKNGIALRQVALLKTADGLGSTSSTNCFVLSAGDDDDTWDSMKRNNKEIVEYLQKRALSNIESSDLRFIFIFSGASDPGRFGQDGQTAILLCLRLPGPEQHRQTEARRVHLRHQGDRSHRSEL